MEDEEYDLYGVQDDYDEQFSSELEVLAELEAVESSRPQPKVSQFRNKRTFEEAIAAGDHVSGSVSGGEIPESNGDVDPGKVKKRDAAFLHLSEEDEFSDSVCEAPLTPKPKRPRIDAVKKLNFGSDDHSANSSAIGDDITPPPSPDFTDKRNESREKFQSCPSLEISDVTPLQVTPNKAEQKRVFNRPPILEDYIHVTSSDGTRVYMTLKDDQTGTGAEDISKQGGLSWRGDQQLHLLGVPITYLKEQVADERRRQVLEESQRLTEMLTSQMNQFEETESEALELDDGEEEDDVTAHNLWVDKYTPKCYTELLSDDYTNRCLLKWLKLWDTVVFGKEKGVKKVKPSTEQKPNFRAQKEQQGKWKTKAQITEEILEAELDQHNRPKYKVALLTGPPGLGKTTLAHVIARHAGYNVVEMNASDDRSPEIFRTRIEAATQMKSVLGADERPNCLIIDEIDGAPTISINMLLNLVNKKDGKDLDSATDGAVTKKKKKDGGLLLRPIICICNDQYVPSLRQLRQQAFGLNFPQTLPSRLVQRLYEITIKQGMKTDTGALMALCEKTENDIRSCINTLQFLRGRGKKELNVRTVQTMKIGLKDQNKSLFFVWQEIFQLPKAQRKRIGQDISAPDLHLLLGNTHDPLNLLGRTPLSAMAQRFHHILHLTTSTGEYEKLTMCNIALWNDHVDGHIREVLSPPIYRSVVLTCPLMPQVNTQLYSMKEKQQLAELINTMLAYNLTYHQERTMDGQYVYKLDPNVEDVCRFPDLPARKQLTYQAKQLISREIELEKMRRSEAFQQARNAARDAAGKKEDKDAEKAAAKPGSLNHEQRLENIMKKTAFEEKPEKDFFGRQIVKKVISTATATTNQEDPIERKIGTAVGNSHVWFRFNEGVSNAVRRNVYIKDLL
ncbi:chromosome transmission fidelity protein 18 homolog [Mantella aurantiaca]